MPSIKYFFSTNLYDTNVVFRYYFRVYFSMFADMMRTTFAYGENRRWGNLKIENVGKDDFGSCG